MINHEIAIKFADDYSSIKLVDSKENKGKGHALKIGIKTTKKFIGPLDADLDIHQKFKRLF